MALEIIREQATPPGETTVVAVYEDITMQTAICFAEQAASKEAAERDDVRHIARSREMGGKTSFGLIGCPGHDPKYSNTSIMAIFSVRVKKEPEELGVKVCPFCGTEEKDLLKIDVKWSARSLEPQDTDNTAFLTEVQCESCARSFWV